MRFLADMGVSLRVVEWLRRRGDDVVHLREQGLHRLPDTGVFEKAVAEGRVVVTSTWISARSRRRRSCGRRSSSFGSGTRVRRT
jgi:hypothetical protein